MIEIIKPFAELGVTGAVLAVLVWLVREMMRSASADRSSLAEAARLERKQCHDDIAALSRELGQIALAMSQIAKNWGDQTLTPKT